MIARDRFDAVSVRSRRCVDGNCPPACGLLEGACSTSTCSEERWTPENRSGTSRSPPTTGSYVDGKLRYDGVRSFLQSRGIDLPFGDPD